MKELNDLAQWDQALAASDQKPVFIFKHSTRCPISAAAYKAVTDWEQSLIPPTFTSSTSSRPGPFQTPSRPP